MSNTTTGSNRLLIILGLTMTLGPLTALSFGTKYADEETWARAQAGLENAKPQDTLGMYGDVNGVPAYASDKTLGDILSGSGVFDAFKSAVADAGDSSILSGTDVYTLFVPSDEAFGRLTESQRDALKSDPDILAAFISKHVVPGRYTATDLMQMGEARTIGGDLVAVGPSAGAGGHIAFGGAEIVKSNIHAANGVVHVLDSVNM